MFVDSWKSPTERFITFICGHFLERKMVQLQNVQFGVLIF